MGIFTPLLLFVLVFIVFHTNAKPMALKKTDQNSLDNKVSVKRGNVFQCHVFIMKSVENLKSFCVPLKITLFRFIL